MITVNSLSGGKTSSYLAVHYPADLEIFALVCVDDHNAAGSLRKDKKLVQMVNDKLTKFIPEYGEFRATTEDPKTLKVMLDLEQFIGREIIWVRGDSWETMMNRKKAVPNVFKRFCTFEMKIKPIFEYLYLNHELPVDMRCGYRFDELERAESFSTEMKASFKCDLDRHIHRWTNIIWRTGSFPLISNRVGHYTVNQFWDGKELIFPDDSNCQNCPWKPKPQLRKNFETNFPIMQWASIQEVVRGRTFKQDISLEQVKQFGLQQEFNFGTGSGCQAGFCTD